MKCPKCGYRTMRLSKEDVPRVVAAAVAAYIMQEMKTELTRALRRKDNKGGSS